jgi:hypothetical protein
MGFRKLSFSPKSKKNSPLLFWLKPFMFVTAIPAVKRQENKNACSL